jgi:hypothetical protein
MRQEKLQKAKERRAFIAFQNCPIFSQKSDSFGNKFSEPRHTVLAARKCWRSAPVAYYLLI